MLLCGSYLTETMEPFMSDTFADFDSCNDLAICVEKCLSSSQCGEINNCVVNCINGINPNTQTLEPGSGLSPSPSPSPIPNPSPSCPAGVPCVCSEQPPTDDLNIKMLEWHNMARAGSGAQPLCFNQDLKNSAQDWVNSLTEVATTHDTLNGMGENLAYGMGGSVQPYDAFNMWVKECSGSDGRHAPYNDQFDLSSHGHYSQIMSQRSTCIGCAEKKFDDGTNIISCRYSPEGNFNVEAGKPHPCIQTELTCPSVTQGILM